MSEKETPTAHTSVGVNYEPLDRFKRLAQTQARTTADHLSRFNMKEVELSRGESAYVWEEPDAYRAFVMEGLGTKNRVADEMRIITGKTYYDQIGQDTIAMIVNDLITVGAEPQVINAYCAVGNANWFSDGQRAKDLAEGWAQACHKADAVWGGGETPILKDVLESDAIDLAGAAIGIIKPKERLALADKLVPGDVIFLIGSSGIHANGLTLAREIATKLSQGYATPLADNKMYGESLLTSTHIYARLIRDYFRAGIDIHYMANITGHGWRKLMRAKRDFTYVIEQIPQPMPIFQFIQEQSEINCEEMYATFNMGAGFAIFMPEQYTRLAQQLAWYHCFDSLQAGYLEIGERQVIIKPKNLIFPADSLNIR